MRNSYPEKTFVQHHSRHISEKHFSLASHPILQGTTKAPFQVCTKPLTLTYL